MDLSVPDPFQRVRCGRDGWYGGTVFQGTTYTTRRAVRWNRFFRYHKYHQTLHPEASTRIVWASRSPVHSRGCFVATMGGTVRLVYRVDKSDKRMGTCERFTFGVGMVPKPSARDVLGGFEPVVD